MKRTLQILFALFFVISLVTVYYFTERDSGKSSASIKAADSIGICGTPFITTENKHSVITRKMIPARFKHGQDSLYDFIDKHIRYPSLALKNRISGKVTVCFTVTEKGSLDSVKAFEPVSPELDKEALRIIKLTDGSWNPAVKEGKPILSHCRLPIEFVLE